MKDNRGRKGQPKCCNCAEYISARVLNTYRFGACRLRVEQKRHSSVHFANAACPEWRKCIEGAK